MKKLVIAKQLFDLLFDDSSDEDSDEDIKIIRSRKKSINSSGKALKQNIRVENNINEDPFVIQNRPKARKTFTEDVVPRMSAKSFKQHFRVNPDIFELICKDIYPFLHKKYGTGRNPLKLEKQVMITLFYLGNRGGLRMIANKFEVSISTTWRTISAVCDAILNMNGEKKIVKWPSSEEAEKTANHYYSIHKLKGVIGCIDSCHITIRTPMRAQKLYVNKKGTHSVLLQAISNEKMEFLFFNAGECGSLDDVSLLEKSGLENKINTGYFKINDDQHLLGDFSYPLKPWLITPYRENVELTDNQIFFNTIHTRCLEDTKRAFGLLKGRFRRLNYIDCLRTAATTKFIAASCIIHNICLHNDDFPDEDVKVEVEENEKEYCDEHEDTLQLASSKRDALMNELHT